MNPTDTVYVKFSDHKKKPPVWCRATVQEVHDTVCRLRVWDGRKFHSVNKMVSECRKDKPE